MHVRRHFRRPKLPDRDESLLSGASFGSRRLPPQARSAAKSSFGCQTWFLPEWQKLSSPMHLCLLSHPNMHKPILQHSSIIHKQTYKFLGASNHQKPQLQHTSNSHCSKITPKTHKHNYDLNMHSTPMNFIKLT